MKLLHHLLSDSSDKGGTQTPLMQMSVGWVDDPAQKEGLHSDVVKRLAERNSKKYERRVVLVTFESSGALDHAKALTDIHQGKLGKDIQPYTEHGITREWNATEIDIVDNARQRAHQSKKSSTPAPQATRSRQAKTIAQG